MQIICKVIESLSLKARRAAKSFIGPRSIAETLNGMWMSIGPKEAIPVVGRARTWSAAIPLADIVSKISGFLHNCRRGYSLEADRRRRRAAFEDARTINAESLQEAHQALANHSRCQINSRRRDGPPDGHRTAFR